jgi:hypothetical protein
MSKDYPKGRTIVATAFTNANRSLYGSHRVIFVRGCDKGLGCAIIVTEPARRVLHVGKYDYIRRLWNRGINEGRWS